MSRHSAVDRGLSKKELPVPVMARVAARGCHVTGRSVSVEAPTSDALEEGDHRCISAMARESSLQGRVLCRQPLIGAVCWFPAVRPRVLCTTAPLCGQDARPMGIAVCRARAPGEESTENGADDVPGFSSCSPPPWCKEVLNCRSTEYRLHCTGIFWRRGHGHFLLPFRHLKFFTLVLVPVFACAAVRQQALVSRVH